MKMLFFNNTVHKRDTSTLSWMSDEQPTLHQVSEFDNYIAVRALFQAHFLVYQLFEVFPLRTFEMSDVYPRAH